MALRAAPGRIGTTRCCRTVGSATISTQLIGSSVGARLFLAHTLRSISGRGGAADAAKHRGEVTRRPEPHSPRDLRDGELPLRQECAGARDALPDHEPVRWLARADLEE